MADAVLTALIGEMKSTVKLRVRMMSESKDEFQRLENDLRLLNGFLHDVDRNEDLERQIKELAYDIQDIRESWLIRRAANTNIWRRFLTLDKTGVYALATKISSPRVDRVDPLFRRIEAYGDLQQLQNPIKVNQVPSMQLKSREFHPMTPNKFVGFEEEAETLISNLMEETEELDVISITGMPGIGKTTLASKIYHDGRICYNFPTRIWVDISHDFSIKDVYLCILKELIKQGMVNMPQASWVSVSHLDILNKYTESGRISDDQLIYEVGASLKLSKFLLVVDDVWTGDALESLRCFLPNTGKILITSRNNHVTGKPHVLRFLNEKESWELLQLEVFGNLDKCPEMLTSLGKRISQNCDGSPLAISIVASSLMVPPSMGKAGDRTHTDIASIPMDSPSKDKAGDRTQTEFASVSMDPPSKDKTGDQTQTEISSVPIDPPSKDKAGDQTQTEIVSVSIDPPSKDKAGDWTQTEIAKDKAGAWTHASIPVDPPSKDKAGDMTKTWWEKVSKNVTKYVTRYVARHNAIERVELSYTKLPEYLQDCFLYLGVFPQGYEIPVWTLIRLWIAEGLVQHSWGLSLEETAERNLYDLVSSNLVMVGKLNSDGQIKTCSLHKVMYAFCKYKAVDQEFYHEIKMSEAGVLDRPTSLTLNHRRLCIYSCLSEFLSSRPKGPCIRSILCFNDGGNDLHQKDISTIHKCFKLLKIFECKGVKFITFPTKLSKLMNLRYISLSCDDVIPRSISLLCYLETLVVHTESASLQLKANIWRMLKLRHLVTKAAIILPRRGKGEAGENLQTLSRLAPECCTEDVFTRIPNLKTLGIRGCLADVSEPESLRRLERLKSLKLINEPRKDIQLDLHCFPPNLKRLTLSGTNLKWECMSMLGKIDSLEILKLKNNAFIGESWRCTADDGFGSLRFLLIKTTDLVCWEASADCFPSLKHLVLNDCQRLQQIPSTPPENLEKVDVDDNVSESASEFARKIDKAKTVQIEPGNPYNTSFTLISRGNEPCTYM